jgi:acid phosphatase type 7
MLKLGKGPMPYLLLLLMGLAAACASPSGPTDGGGTSGGGRTGETVTVIGVGDIGVCGRPEVAQVARLVSTLEGHLLLAGDIAYFQGTAAQFRDCFNPSWGQFRPRWNAVPGNHEYESPGAAPYFAYFGDAAGAGGTGYYSLARGDWLILMLNSNLPATNGSPQWHFVRGELLGQRTPCTMAVWHHPEFTSGPNGSNRGMRDVWALLDAARAEVILNGHEHLYERFARQLSDGTADPANGVRQFTAGTGGAELYNFVRSSSNSEERVIRYGVIRFTLRPAQVEWEFITLDGSVADRGLDTCR